jgi:hypothetical protein
VQTISVLLAVPSQWALKYFDPSAARQEHAAFAHFFGWAIASPFPPPDFSSVGMAYTMPRASGKDGVAAPMGVHPVTDCFNQPTRRLPLEKREARFAETFPFWR